MIKTPEYVEKEHCLVVHNNLDKWIEDTRNWTNKIDAKLNKFNILLITTLGSIIVALIAIIFKK